MKNPFSHHDDKLTIPLGKVEGMIHDKLAKREKLHFTLVDPDPKKVDIEEFKERVRKMEEWGCDAIMIGGSTSNDQVFLDEVVKCVKDNSKMPTILFPGGMSGISRYADSIFFMSLMNSKDPFWICNIHVKAAPLLAKLGIEVMPMCYLIVEPGMKVGEVGKAEVLKKGENDRAAGYALAAQMFGFRLVYLEAGSGAHTAVPVDMVKAAKSALKNTTSSGDNAGVHDTPLIVGGGIRTPEAAVERLEAGADIIVTGTIIEEKFENLEKIIRAVKNYGK